MKDARAWAEEYDGMVVQRKIVQKIQADALEVAGATIAQQAEAIKRLRVAAQSFVDWSQDAHDDADSDCQICQLAQDIKAAIGAERGGEDRE